MGEQQKQNQEDGNEQNICRQNTLGSWPKRKQGMVGHCHSANLPQASLRCWSTTMNHKDVGARVSTVTQQDPMGPSWERPPPTHVLCLPLVCRKTLAS